MKLVFMLSLSGGKLVSAVGLLCIPENTAVNSRVQVPFDSDHALNSMS